MNEITRIKITNIISEMEKILSDTASEYEISMAQNSKEEIKKVNRARYLEITMACLMTELEELII